MIPPVTPPVGPVPDLPWGADVSEGVFYSTEPLSLQDIAAGRLLLNYQYSAGTSGSLSPIINPDIFNGVILAADGYVSGDGALGVSYFEGKSRVIHFERIGSNVSVPIITQIELRPAPTMTFLNPRPAAGSPGYPWRWDGHQDKVIQLPLSLTYDELKQGSQIVVSGVTDSLAVIDGVVENDTINFRASGLLIAQIGHYQGEQSAVSIYIMEEFTGEVLAVNFDKAYKNLPAIDGLSQEDGVGPYRYVDIEQNKIARCVLNNNCFSANPLPCLPNISAGDVYRVYQSVYVRNVGDAIETSIVYAGHDLYVIQVGMGWKLKVIRPIVNDGWLITYPEI